MILPAELGRRSALQFAIAGKACFVDDDTADSLVDVVTDSIAGKVRSTVIVSSSTRCGCPSAAAAVGRVDGRVGDRR